jgi:hypothetical protein
MKKKLIIVLNDEVNPFGRVLNAIGHMMVGVSPRFPKEKFPVIEIYSASANLVRNFRTLAYDLNAKLSDNKSVFSDFSHTTTDGSAKDHEKQTSAIKEADINYFSTCICAENADLSVIDELLATDAYSHLHAANTVFSNIQTQAEFEFTAPINYPEVPTFIEEKRKFSISLTKLSIQDTITALVKAIIDLGRKASRDELRLHTYPDADGILHPGMSEYGLVALDTKTVKRLNELKTTISGIELNSTGECRDQNDQLIALSLFGLTDTVNAATKKGIQLWKGDIVTNKSGLQQVSVFKNVGLTH